MNLRTQSKVKIRQPLGTLYVRPKDAADRRVLENADYVAQILEEANLKKVVLIDDESALVKVRLKPDAKKTWSARRKVPEGIAQALSQADPGSLAEAGRIRCRSTGRPLNSRRTKSSSPTKVRTT